MNATVCPSHSYFRNNFAPDMPDSAVSLTCLFIFHSKPHKKRYESLTNILISDFANSSNRCSAATTASLSTNILRLINHTNKWHFHHDSFWSIKLSNIDLKRQYVPFNLHRHRHCVNLNVQFRFKSERPTDIVGYYDAYNHGFPPIQLCKIKLVKRTIKCNKSSLLFV